MNKMKALVKAKAAKGLWMQEVPVPEPGYNDVIIKGEKIGHLRYRPAYLRME